MCFPFRLSYPSHSEQEEIICIVIQTTLSASIYGIVVSLWLTLIPGLFHSSSSVLLSAILMGKMRCARMSVEENVEALE